MHLIIPYAACKDDGCQKLLPSLDLPWLALAMRQLEYVSKDEAGANSLSAIHERALANAYGWQTEDGKIPWMAWHQKIKFSKVSHGAWARITPCHWQVGMNDVRMLNPEFLGLTENESQVLCAAMQPYFEEDGIELTYLDPLVWAVKMRSTVGTTIADSSDVHKVEDGFRSMGTASLDRVIGCSVSEWWPSPAKYPWLHRLQNEMQMLLYTHATNSVRIERGLLPVNAFWLSDVGAMSDGTLVPKSATVRDTMMPMAMRSAALNKDWTAWVQAWQVVDVNYGEKMVQALREGLPVTLTLCGDGSARTYQSVKKNWQKKIQHQITQLLRPNKLIHILSQL